MRFQPTSMSRDDIECTPIVKRADNENTCGTSASCDIDIRLHCVFAALLASLRGCIVVLPVSVRCAFLYMRGNTSLSRTVFFSMRWCIRDVVHLDSRVHAAIKPSHTSGGQHGQELRRQRRRRAQ